MTTEMAIPLTRKRRRIGGKQRLSNVKSNPKRLVTAQARKAGMPPAKSQARVALMVDPKRVTKKLKDCLYWAGRRTANPKRGLPPMTITLDYLERLWKRQRGLCALTGIPLQASGGLGATLDRVVPRKGYVPGNVKIVCACANAFKGDMSMRDFRQHWQTAMHYWK